MTIDADEQTEGCTEDYQIYVYTLNFQETANRISSLEAIQQLNIELFFPNPEVLISRKFFNNNYYIASMMSEDS